MTERKKYISSLPFYKWWSKIINYILGRVDLVQITLPAFILEPRSLLERVTDVFGHPYIILQTPQLEDPMDRFLSVVKFFLSSWHLKPKGVKKPYYPITGEFFRCQWKYRDQSQAFYIAEQIPAFDDDHLPTSAYYYACPEHDLVITGNLKLQSKFLGNSVVTSLGGHHYLYFTELADENGTEEIYEITLPEMCIKGVIFGTMFTEFQGIARIVCKKTNIACELEFKPKVSYIFLLDFFLIPLEVF
jgi:hypothetical protein